MKSVIIKGQNAACCGRSAPSANLTPQSGGVSDLAESLVIIIAK
jgi:hypothetical protein